jgi:low affinity Fe/Cu permease
MTAQADQGRRRHHLARRTAQLPASSRILYRIDHHTSRPSASVVVVGALVALLVLGAALGFPSGWVTGCGIGMSGATLVMVFAIQHTQGREQAASQRKLDELLRAIPGAEERLMMLEEAPDDVLHGVVEDQRGQQDDATAREPAHRGGDPTVSG